jgi:hypothetical protein
MKNEHRHRAIPARSTTYGYVGYSVRPDHPNPLAHGGVTHYDYCRCGARRLTNSTGAKRTERGPWQTADGADFA